MTDLVQQVQRTFEDIRLEDETGFEFWSARDLMIALGYKEWRKFSWVIEKAKISCKNSNGVIEDHFVPSDKMVELGSGSQRKITNYLLTRYACYLIAQNGDSRKTEIALAQTYFASQTRKLEIHEQNIEEEKRLVARKKLQKTEREIEETIYNRGVKLPVEFATFKNKGIEALYGISVKALKKRRRIPEKRALADFDSELELKAKDFTYAVTDHNIKKHNLSGKGAMESELIENSKGTRKVLLERGIVPEELEPQEDIKKIEQRREQQKKLSEKKRLS